MNNYPFAAFLLLLLLFLLPGGQARANPAFRSFDDTMTAYMTVRGIPGGALAVVKEGRLVYTKGYGWADREKKVPVAPTSLFRIASISKPVTAAAIFTLIQDKENHLSLDTPVFPLLPHKPLAGEEGQVDPRLTTITIRQLLQHTGGWDKAESGDPMFKSMEIARALFHETSPWCLSRSKCSTGLRTTTLQKSDFFLLNFCRKKSILVPGSVL